MRITQVLLHAGIGGAETLAHRLDDAWREMGVESTTVFADPYMDLGRIARMRRVRAELERTRPDVVVAHSALPNLYTRLVWRRTPVIAVLHSSVDDFTGFQLRTAERLLRRRHPTVVAVSAVQADRYAARFGASARPVVIPNGIAEVPDVDLTVTPHPAHAVTIARVAAQKNPRLWLETVRDASTALPDLAFTWWGPVTDDEGRATVEAAREVGIADAFRGPTDEPLDVIAGAHLYFHPSWHEAHSVSILEAAAAGLPVVCSEDVALTLPDGLAAATFDPTDPGTAVTALATVSRRWKSSRAHAARRRASIRAQYSMEACARAYIGLAEDLAPEGALTR
ncbi:glycosyltransferase [Demequina soli]|uniref:glycosyltransferase n=1 Tax=Demequina soli TaxID=1638987 RepID=UPI0007855D5E|nr:glycosyltransferase [Demequina soli]